MPGRSGMAAMVFRASVSHAIHNDRFAPKAGSTRRLAAQGNVDDLEPVVAACIGRRRCHRQRPGQHHACSHAGPAAAALQPVVRASGCRLWSGAHVRRPTLNVPKPQFAVIRGSIASVSNAVGAVARTPMPSGGSRCGTVLQSPPVC